MYLKKDILLPVVNKKKLMSFFSWKKNDLLFINEFERGVVNEFCLFLLNSSNAK